MTDAEIWLPVEGYEGRYEVSSHGRVRSLLPRYEGRILRQYLTRGYFGVDLQRGARGNRQRIAVHVLVLTSFTCPRPDGMFGLHNDGDKRNNKVGNLRWGTASENSFDAVRHGVHPMGRKTHCPYDHLYDEANTYLSPSGRRECRICRSARRRAAA